MSQNAPHPGDEPQGRPRRPDSETGDAWTAPPPQRTDAGGGGWVTGGITFAGVLMLVGGVLAILQGVAAISDDHVYASVGTYIYEINLTGWGWIHVVLGALFAITGWGVLTGAAWGRVAGIALASLSLVAQFLFLPYAPVWSVVMMAIDVFIIWALASGQEAASRRRHAAHGGRPAPL
ncbi:hypothetical protein ACIQNG_18290 [Streptomyces sp. NPDC091377]|uniref:DUF7144 family membrane protein n=1 Tax=unclassified Streptomyces TaxID=2593676 RepID=UPI00381B88BE